MTESQTAVAAVLDRHLGLLAQPGVLSVRPGYLFTDAGRRVRPVIVATVDPTRVQPGRLPSNVEGIPVDVRAASDRKRALLAGEVSWPLGRHRTVARQRPSRNALARLAVTLICARRPRDTFLGAKPASSRLSLMPGGRETLPRGGSIP